MTNMHHGSKVQALIDQYCQVWNESDQLIRLELLAPIWAENGTYTDPTVHTIGSTELLSHTTKVQAKRPGSKVARTSDIDVHHGMARFSWHVVKKDGSTLPEGLDLVFLTPGNEKIERIVGFFGPLNPL